MKCHFVKYLVTALLCLIVWSCDIDSPLTNNNKTPMIKNETKWKISNNDEAKLYKISLKEYQLNGKLSKITEYLVSGEIKSVAQFIYDKNVSYEEIMFFNGDNSVDSVFRNIYVHNLIGKIERKISFSADGDTSSIIDYSYDQKGNLVRKIQKDLVSNSSVVTDIKYVYNFDGHVVGRLINPDLNGTYESRDSIAYQSQGIKVVLYNYNREGDINLIYTYFYNVFGHISKEFQSTKDGIIISKYEYDYTYWN